MRSGSINTFSGPQYFGKIQLRFFHLFKGLWAAARSDQRRGPRSPERGGVVGRESEAAPLGNIVKSASPPHWSAGMAITHFKLWWCKVSYFDVRVSYFQGKTGKKWLKIENISIPRRDIIE